jgi:uncharacterized membrane protein
MLSVIDQRVVEDLDRRTEQAAAPEGMFDFLESKAFAAATVAAITAVVCFVSGFGGEVGLLVISPLMALVYWLMFR